MTTRFPSASDSDLISVVESYDDAGLPARGLYRLSSFFILENLACKSNISCNRTKKPINSNNYQVYEKKKEFYFYLSKKKLLHPPQKNPVWSPPRNLSNTKKPFLGLGIRSQIYFLQTPSYECRNLLIASSLIGRYEQRRESTFSRPCFPSWQHFGHSQLLGRSSLIVPSFSRFSCFFRTHSGWLISQQIQHSIRVVIISSGFSEDFTRSSFPQIIQIAAFGITGWKKKIDLLHMYLYTSK